MAGPGRAFFDTNIFVYSFDAAEPEKRRKAALLVERHRDAGRLALSTQVLQEFFWVTTRTMRKPLSVEQARREVERLAELDPLQVDSRLVVNAIDRSRSAQISFWDGLVVEAALRAGCSTLYSEDLQDGWVVDGRLTVVNPFAAGS